MMRARQHPRQEAEMLFNWSLNTVAEHLRQAVKLAASSKPPSESKELFARGEYWRMPLRVPDRCLKPELPWTRKHYWQSLLARLNFLGAAKGEAIPLVQQ